MWYRTEFDFNILFIHLRTRKMFFNALVFTLRSKVELNWAHAIRPVIAQSVQCSKITKKQKKQKKQKQKKNYQKTEHRFVPIFFSSKGSTVLIKIKK